MINKFKNWVIKNWIKITNWVVLISVYSINQNDWIELILGLWIFTQLAYAGWVWFKKSN